MKENLSFHNGMMLFAMSVVIAATSLCACSDSGSTDEPTQPSDLITPIVKQDIGGCVEKGPFIQGSKVTLYELTGSLEQTGKNFTTQTKGDLGTFGLTTAMSLQSQFVELETSGYFFNEVCNEFSAAPITLRALSDVTDRNTVNVNLLTHLEFDRVRRLVADGKTFAQAKQQARKELLAIFGIHTATGEPETFSITAGTSQSAILVAISAVMLANRSEAEFSEFIAAFAQDFSDNGTLDDGRNLERLHEGQIQVDADAVTGHIHDYYADKGMEISVPALSAFIDYDGDGTAGNELYDPAHPVTADVTSIHATSNGGNYEVHITSTIPLYKNPPFLEIPTVPYDPTNHIELTYTLNENILNIKIAPAQYKNLSPRTITLYDVLGTEAFSIIVTQDGKTEAQGIEVPEILQEDGIYFVSHYARLNNSSSTTGLNYCLEWDASAYHSRWVAFVFDNTNNARRIFKTDAWAEDPDLPQSARLSPTSYSGSGYSRGQLCASSDRLNSNEANQQTFYMSNMTPQLFDYNGGYWDVLNHLVQRWGRNGSFNRVYVCKGGTIRDNQLRGEFNTINAAGQSVTVKIPKYNFMAILAETPGGGYQAVGFLIEHKIYYDSDGKNYSYDNPAPTYLMKSHAMCIDDLEEFTGINFFCNLDDEIEDIVESTYLDTAWNWE